MKSRLFYAVPLMILLGSPIAFAEEEKEEIVYFSLEENPEIVKERVSDAFWENPMNTPPMIFLIAIAGVGIIVAWRRKWHIHEKTEDAGRE